MYLRELRLNGFKSFVDNARILLEPGVTAIVGPNGCGKSNIADAIRWVLGEQSAKSLRAGTMQDVIFQGTDSRKAVNLCEVSLVFTDCEAELGTAFNEVEITRRVSRDGTSDYRLNGRSCRLKDIQRLFLDTGIGRVSYSFMVQGQIDQILSSNPAERRVIFEEAAGISKYKAQRREALNKLALVDTNLARVTDIIEEVSRQIESLKRQAYKALRYKRIKHRHAHLDLASSAHRHGLLQQFLREVEVESEELGKRASELNRELGEREEDLAKERAARFQLYEKLQDAQQAVFELRTEKEQAENKAELAGIRIADHRSRMGAIESEISALEEQRSSLAKEAAGSVRSKEELLSRVGSSDRTFNEHYEELESVESQLSECEGDLQQLKQELMMTESRVVRLRSECSRLEVDLKTYQVRHSTLADELYTLEQNQFLLRKDRKGIAAALGRRREDRGREERALGELQSKRSQLEQTFRKLQIEIQTLDREEAQNVARVHLLTSLQEKMEGFGEGAKAILQGKLSHITGDSKIQFLSKVLEVGRGYTEALVALLADGAEALLLADPTQVVPLTRELESRKLGRACLKIDVPRPLEGDKWGGEKPDWLIPSAEVVGAKRSDVQPHLRDLLNGCFFCSGVEEFLEFWRENPKFPFVLVATQQGALIDRRGLIYGGYRRGEADTFLQRASEIESLNAAVAAGEKKIGALRSNADEFQEQLNAVELAAEKNRSLILEIAQEISTAEAQNASAEKTLAETAGRIEQVAKEAGALEEGKDESTQGLERVKGELDAVEVDLEARRNGIAVAENRLAEVRSKAEAKRAGLADMRIERAEKRQRLELIDHGLVEVERQSEELSRLAVRRGQEMDALHEQIAVLENEIVEQRSRAREIETTLTISLHSVDQDRGALKTTEQRIQELEDILTGQRQTCHEVETDLNQRAVRMARIRSEVGFLVEEVRREYDEDLAAVDWKREIWTAGDRLIERVKLDLDEEDVLDEEDGEVRAAPTEEDLSRIEMPDWAVVGEECEQLRARLSAMGSVNLIAIEEYRELSERFDFLREQSDDLWKSKDQLLAAIDEINQISQAMFQETFEQVRRNFAYTFESLFGGGSGDLRLIDKEDVLESGIDITARPPGTRLRTLALLSGGQKTMTAVALLFAIYMVKPSPFCLLDELDAPLDDANIGRFVEILLRFTRYSQFVIITHNKRTIASSHGIYGVTMQERGVSKMVSMRFNTETDRPEKMERREVEAEVKA